MSQLELIWGLEKHNNLLEKHSKDLDIIKNNLDLDKLSQRHNNIENKLVLLNTKLENNKKNTMEKENILNNFLFTLKETEDELYSGSIVDFHQLDFLSKEKIPAPSELEVFNDGFWSLKHAGFAVCGREALDNIRLFYFKENL